MYSLGGADLAIFDFTAIRQDDSDIALSGFMDDPVRTGKTFHDWANEDGIEPYVSLEEIASGGFGGRDMSLKGVIQGVNLQDCNSKLASLYTHIDTFTGLATLVTDYSTHYVSIGAITGTYLADTGLAVTISMHEPFVPNTGTVPVGNSSEFGIDGISFASLGGAMLELRGDRWNRPALKKIDTTAYGKEAYQMTRKQAPTLDLKLVIKASTFSELIGKVANLRALFNSPGLRSLTVNNDKIRSFFVKDGFTVSMIHAFTDDPFCVIDCKLTESGSARTLQDLATMLGDLITYQGNVIQARF